MSFFQNSLISFLRLVSIIRVGKISRPQYGKIHSTIPIVEWYVVYKKVRQVYTSL